MEKQLLYNDIFSGSMCVSKATRINFVSINTNIKWFQDSQIIVKDDGEKLIFKKPTIDYNGKTLTPIPTRSEWVGFTIKSNIPLMHYQVSAESDEDTLIFKYN